MDTVLTSFTQHYRDEIEWWRIIATNQSVQICIAVSVVSIDFLWREMNGDGRSSTAKYQLPKAREPKNSFQTFEFLEYRSTLLVKR
jgi:hypothetical protein